VRRKFRANEYFVLWLLISFGGGGASYFALQFADLSEDWTGLAVAVIAGLSMRLMDGYFENAMYMDLLRSAATKSGKEIVEYVIKRSSAEYITKRVNGRNIIVRIEVRKLGRYVDINKYFRVKTYIDDTEALIVKITDTMTWYVFGTVFFFLSVSALKYWLGTHSGTNQIDLSSYVSIAPIAAGVFGVFFTGLRCWLPVAHFASRNARC